MKARVLGLIVVALGLTFVVSNVHDKRSVMAYSTEDSLNNDCSEQLRDFGRHYQSVVRGEETRSITNQPLKIVAEHNSGISISTWDRPDFSVKLCKQVASDSDEQGKRILHATKLAVNDTTVSVSSPHREGDYNLNALLLVKAPRDAQVRMKVENGGISVQHFTGTANARSTNGGISMDQSSGKLTVHAKNGGVSLQDCGGDVTAEVENGGLSITLPQLWDGKGLEAHAQNGGLVIRFPRNFASGLEVNTSNHVPIVCKGDACDQGERTSDNGQRRFRLGSAPQVHATAVNGSVVIENREH